MARVSFNPAIRQISGRLGDFVYRCYRDGALVVAKAPLPNHHRRRSAAQLAQQQRFKEGAARRLCILADPETRAAYQVLCAVRGPLARLNTLVIGDSMKPPVIRLLDLSDYHGQVGDTIRVVAEDNVAVARFSLAILDQTTGQLLEAAEERLPIDRLAPTLAWSCAATAPAPMDHALEIRVTVYDLAGNQTSHHEPLAPASRGGSRTAPTLDGEPWHPKRS